MNFVRKPLNSLVKLQQMFRIAEIELGIKSTIGITFETGVGVQSAILHVCVSAMFRKLANDDSRFERLDPKGCPPPGRKSHPFVSYLPKARKHLCRKSTHP